MWTVTFWMWGPIGHSGSAVYCVSETWLTQNTLHTNVDLPGFTTVTADRDCRRSGKCKGGGLTLFINTRWCNQGHVMVKVIVCNRDFKLLAVSLRPYYMARVLPRHCSLCLCPSIPHAETVCDVVHSAIARLLNTTPRRILATSGDFNHVIVDSTLPDFQ